MELSLHIALQFDPVLLFATILFACPAHISPIYLSFLTWHLSSLSIRHILFDLPLYCFTYIYVLPSTFLTCNSILVSQVQQALSPYQMVFCNEAIPQTIAMGTRICVQCRHSVSGHWCNRLIGTRNGPHYSHHATTSTNQSLLLHLYQSYQLTKGIYFYLFKWTIFSLFHYIAWHIVNDYILYIQTILYKPI